MNDYTYKTEMEENINELKIQYKFLRDDFSTKIYTSLDSYGIKISLWYLNSSYFILMNRSKIIEKIIEYTKNETDIKFIILTPTIEIK